MHDCLPCLLRLHGIIHGHGAWQLQVLERIRFIGRPIYKAR